MSRNLGVELGTVAASARTALFRVSSSAAEGAKEYDFSLPRVRRPFLMPANIVWTTLPGEAASFFPYFDNDTATHARRTKKDNQIVVAYRPDPKPNWMLTGEGEGFFAGGGFDAVAQIKDYELRALAGGSKWMRRSSNVRGCTGRASGGTGEEAAGECWSIYEEYSIAAFIGLLMGWRNEIDADIRYLKKNPQHAPALIQAKVLGLEIDAGIGALSAFQNALFEVRMRGTTETSQVVNQAVA